MQIIPYNQYVKNNLDKPKKCSLCGEISTNFTPSTSNCRPCAAKRVEKWRKNNPEKHKKLCENFKHGDKANRYRKKYPHKALWGYAKSRSKKSNLEFSISAEDIVIPTHCPIFGFELEIGKCKENGKPKFNSMSLDRIDPTKGYIKGNIWVISHRANWIKNNSSLEELELITQKLREKTNERKNSN